MMHILIDQDGVLANFYAGVLARWRRLYPGRHIVPEEERQNFYLSDDYSEEHRADIENINYEAGLFRQLPVVEGSQEAVRLMVELGHQVTICTAPLTGNPTTRDDKYHWLQEHFGHDLARRMVLTKDKTIIRGDVLIDDNPSVRGMMTPEWEHIVYDQPYNRQVTGSRRLTWQNWRQVLNI